MYFKDIALQITAMGGSKGVGLTSVFDIPELELIAHRCPRCCHYRAPRLSGDRISDAVASEFADPLLSQPGGAGG